MDNAEKLGRIRSTVLVARIITAGFMATMVILNLVCWILFANGHTPAGLLPEVCYALAGVGAASLAAAHFIGDAFAARACTQGEAAHTAEASDSAKLDRSVSTLLFATILTGALAEAAGVLGFVASFMSGDLLFVQTLGAAAFLLLFLKFPAEGQLEVCGFRDPNSR